MEGGKEGGKEGKDVEGWEGGKEGKGGAGIEEWDWCLAVLSNATILKVWAYSWRLFGRETTLCDTCHFICIDQDFGRRPITQGRK